MTPSFAQEKLLRAPYLQPRSGTDEPLIVLCSFLSRADNTPLQERRRGDGHMLDAQGQVIADPAVDPAANAFEGNPNLNFEKWGEYWRKVHGVRFTYVEEPDDRSLERLQRYDQLHRVAAGPTESSTPPYAAPIDDNGRLFPTVIGHIAPYRRPRWDGIAYLNFAGPEDIAAALANKRVRSKILPEDQAIFRDIAPVLSRQYILLPSASGNDAITLVKTHVRRPDSSRAEFQRWWLQEHADTVLAQPDTPRLVKRYVQLHNIGPTETGQPFFHPETSGIDGVTLMAFASMNDLEDFLLTDSQRVIADSEATMTAAGSTEYWTALGFVLVNRIAPEQVSRRTQVGA
ncbi:EthD domain-containing protein [Sulfuriferula sp. GW1]|uniref:EthD domain-containing protein n=1 Tax=Sulfuriferula sp. GW1 TaxID=3345111 RepID=UPI0039B0E7C9